MTDAAPLSDDELDALDDFFARRSEEFGDIAVSTADGFITAVAMSPAYVAPREWMEALFGPFDQVFSDKAEEQRLCGLAWRRHQEIVASLQADPPTFEPVMEADADDWPLGEIWAEGFLMGMGLRIDSWSPLLQHDLGNYLMTPILALGDPDALAQLEPRKAKRARMAGQLSAQLSSVSPTLERMTRALREGRSLDEAEGVQALRAELEEIEASTAAPIGAPKAGRNDSCPCGSGQKFKRCCGAASS